ncbi:E3 ubiquitin ligase [Thecaphora frezii]
MESATTRAAEKKKRTRSAVKQDDAKGADDAKQEQQEQHTDPEGSEERSDLQGASNRDERPVTTRQRSASSERPAKRGKKRRMQSTGADQDAIETSLEPNVLASDAQTHEAEAVAGPSSSTQSGTGDASNNGDTAANSKGKLKEEPPTGSEAAEAALTDSQDLQQQIEFLKKELATKNELITSQRSTISHIYHQCTCTICLELVWRPFILAPCGHTFCVVCLKSWFTKPLEKEGDLPGHLNDEERQREVQRRTLKRKKTCPACRTELACAPVEIWLVKGMLEKLESSAKVVGASGSGFTDEALTSLEIAKARGDDLPSGTKLWEDIFDGRGPRRVLYDEGDGVRRCGECASEIWDGMCSNPACGMEYSDLSDDEYASDVMPPPDNLYGHYANPTGRRPRNARYDPDDFSRSEDSQFSDSEDDMRSFIEDDIEDERGDRDRSRDRDREDDDDEDDEDEEGEDDDGFIAGPRRVYRNDGDDPIEISDDDEQYRVREGSGRRRSEGRRASHESIASTDDESRISIAESGVSSDGEHGRRERVRRRRKNAGRVFDSENSDEDGGPGSEGEADERSIISDEERSDGRGYSDGGSEREGAGYETADDSREASSGPSTRHAGRRIVVDSEDED